MTGAEYANLVAAYVAAPVRRPRRSRSIARSGSARSIIGKNRCIDVFCVCEATNKAFAIECKFQDSQGTVDEKIPTRSTISRRCRWPAVSPMPARDSLTACCTCLRASTARRLLPAGCRSKRHDADTKELDHLLAMHFGWWDVFVGKKKPVSATSATAANGGASTGALDLTDSFLDGPDFPG